MFRFDIKVDKLTAHLIKVPEVICDYVRQKTFHAVLHGEKEGRGVSLRVYYREHTVQFDNEVVRMGRNVLTLLAGPRNKHIHTTFR